MEKKVRNPVLRSIANADFNNRLDNYIPQIHVSEGSGQISYGISVKLPKECKKWIANIIGSERFRSRVREEIERVFSTHVFNGQSYLEIRWFLQGPSFETDGVNGCMVYVPPEDPTSYSYHNIDNYEQASVLFVALSVYLRQMHFLLEELESGELNPEKFQRLKELVINKINLNKVKDCQMTFEQCIHKCTWICDLCTRNPKSYHIQRQKDLDKIGDKWEPEGGLPGKNICPVCGANISSEKCPYCKE